MTMMRAVVHDRYGAPDVLRIDSVERPTPVDDAILVRVHSTTVNRTDCGFRQGDPVIVRFFSGLRRPRFRILGNEYAGVVEQVGPAVTKFSVGDRVFGVNQATFGANADYVCVPQDSPVATMPDGMTFDEGAAVCDGFVLASTCLAGAGLRAGQRILIYGATGSIGTAAVQLAHDMGAHVTAVADSDTLDLVRSLGADVTIDRHAQDFRTIGQTWDIVFDAVGKLSFRYCRRVVRPRGPYVTTDLGRFWHAPVLVLLTAVTGRLGTRRVLLPLPSYRQQEVLLLREMFATGRYRAVIDRRYPFAETIDATRYVQGGQKTGNVVVTVVDTPAPPPSAEITGTAAAERSVNRG